MKKKLPDPHVAWLVICARCSFQGWSSPADTYNVGQRPYARACLTTRGGYPSFPDLFLCETCKLELSARHLETAS